MSSTAEVPASSPLVQAASAAEPQSTPKQPQLKEKDNMDQGGKDAATIQVPQADSGAPKEIINTKYPPAKAPDAVAGSASMTVKQPRRVKP